MVKLSRITHLMSLALLMAICLSGCGGRAGGNQGLQLDADSNRLLPAGGAQAIFPVIMRPQEPQELPLKWASSVTPQTLLNQVPGPKAVKYTQADLVKTGAGFGATMPKSRVSALNSLGVFAPAQSGGNPVFSDLAYATYEFAIAGYDGEANLGLVWEAGNEPVDYANLWLGFSKWGDGHWEWYQGPADGVLTTAALTPYIETGTGRMLVVVLVMGDQACALKQLRVGALELRGTGAINGDEAADMIPPLAGGGSLPASVDLSPGCSPIRDQGQVGSCTAFAIADGAFNYELKRIYGPYGWDFAEQFNLNSPKYMYGETGLEQGLGCPDEGRYTSMCVDWLSREGNATELNAPYADICDYSWSQDALDDAALLNIESYASVDPRGDAGLVKLKTILANQQVPLVLQTGLDLNFFYYEAGTVWNYEGPVVGYHAMLIVGYDDARQAFKVRNSWSTDWGENGYVWIGYPTFSAADPSAYLWCWTLRDEYDPAVALRFLGYVAELAPPTNVQASDGDFADHIALSWDKSANATGYRVFRDMQDNQIAEVGDVAVWDDATVADYLGHTYWVQSYNATTESELSAPDIGYLAQAPVINTVVPKFGEPGQVRRFVASVYGSSPMTYAWDFGGGASPNTSDLVSPQVTLGAQGQYAASLTVSNSFGADMYSFTLTVATSDPPVALIQTTPNPPTGDAPLAITFDGSASYDPDGGIIVLYEWDIDNDSTVDGAGASFQHTYPNPGQYTAVMTVTDDEGFMNQAQVVVNVSSGANQDPVASFMADPTSGTPPLVVDFDASASNDPDGMIAKYEWDWDGGGTYDFDSGTDPTVAHTYAAVGIYTPILRVTDNFGATDTETLTITVGNPNQPPIADLQGDPLTGAAPLLVNLDGSASSDADGTIALYEFDWENDGTFDESGTSATTQHIFDTPGTYTATLRVTDDDGAQDTDSLAVTVDAPGTWHVVTVASDGNVGNYPSLAMINGVPAISYQDVSNSDLKFTIAQDALGGIWTYPVSADWSGSTGYYTSLAEVNGKPAVTFYYSSGSYGYTGYIRATAVDGSTWGSRINIGPYDGCVYAKLCVINGNPASAMYYNSSLRFTHALDADGASWVTLVNIGASGGTRPWLLNVNSRPAVAWQEGGMIKYARAADAAGDTWGAPVNIDTGNDDVSLVIANGKPAICWYRNSPASVRYCQALDADGTTWGIPQIVIDNPNGDYVSMAIIAGKPAIVFESNASHRVTYMPALDANGSTWDAAQLVDPSGDPDWYASLCDVSGHPAVAYYESTNDDLRFAIKY